MRSAPAPYQGSGGHSNWTQLLMMVTLGLPLIEDRKVWSPLCEHLQEGAVRVECSQRTGTLFIMPDSLQPSIKTIARN